MCISYLLLPNNPSQNVVADYKWVTCLPPRSLIIQCVWSRSSEAALAHMFLKDSAGPYLPAARWPKEASSPSQARELDRTCAELPQHHSADGTHPEWEERVAVCLSLLHHGKHAAWRGGATLRCTELWALLYSVPRAMVGPCPRARPPPTSQ